MVPIYHLVAVLALDIFWPAFESSIAFIQDQLDCRPTKDEDKFVRSVNGLLLISC